MGKRKRNDKDTLVVDSIPIPLGAQHEPSPHDVLPNHEFSMGIVAPKGAGKTTLICNLLKFYKGYFHTIIVFSPTVSNDEKWDWVKRQKGMLKENVELKQFLKKTKKQEGDNPVVAKRPDNFVEDQTHIPEIKKKDERFDGIIPEHCFNTEYTEEDLQDILNQQQDMIDYLKEHGKTKHLANRLLIIFDDLVGSTLFSGARRNPFKMLNTNHRHFSCSMFMVSQAYKEFPKTVRTNFSSLILFEIFSDKEIEAISQEYPMGMKKPQWEEAYNYCIAEPYGFLFYNMQRPPKLRVMKKFDRVIFFREEAKSKNIDTVDDSETEVDE